MTLPDKIERCDECGWFGDPVERCPDCELDERIKAADACEFWNQGHELANHLRAALSHMPYPDQARKALKGWDSFVDNITNP